eukprot:5891099-Karenia_brevis.AAC.1
MPSIKRTEDCITESKRLKIKDCTRNGKVWYQNGNTRMKPENGPADTIFVRVGTNILVKEFVPEKLGGSSKRCKMTE